MTLWIHTLEGRTLNKDSDDHSMMHELADELDQLCMRLGVEPLSSFFDTTDLELNMGGGGDDDEYGDEASAEYDEDEEDEDEDEFDDEDDDALDGGFEADPETGLAYGIDDMRWFDAAVGLRTLESLRDQLSNEPPEDLDDDDLSMLLEEIDDCIEKLQDVANRGGKFNLPVVM